jgi:nucleoid DNA-binding protein
MNKSSLAALLAKQSRVSRATAADRIDRVVHRIITSLRKGEAVRVPGLGHFEPGKTWTFEPEPDKRDGPR